MQINSMKDQAKAKQNGRVKVNRGATRLQQKKPFSFKRIIPTVPMWLVQVVFVSVLLGSSIWGLQQVSWGWPVEKVEIEGEFRYWQGNDLAEQLLWVKEQNFFSLDVRQVKYEIEQLALIKSAQVKKVWPETLLIKFKEDIPVAVWNQQTLLNPKGDELMLPARFNTAELPKLFGPAQKTEQVMRQYQRFQSRLSSLDVAMVSLTMTAVGSWQIELDNGWTIRLGRKQIEQRVERLVELLKILPHEKVAVVDLRYGKGAAIKWLPA